MMMVVTFPSTLAGGDVNRIELRSHVGFDLHISGQSGEVRAYNNQASDGVVCTGLSIGEKDFGLLMIGADIHPRRRVLGKDHIAPFDGFHQSIISFHEDGMKRLFRLVSRVRHGSPADVLGNPSVKHGSVCTLYIAAKIQPICCRCLAS